MVKSLDALKIFKSWSSPLITEQKKDFKASVLQKQLTCCIQGLQGPRFFCECLRDSQDTVLTQEINKPGLLHLGFLDRTTYVTFCDYLSYLEFQFEDPLVDSDQWPPCGPGYFPGLMRMVLWHLTGRCDGEPMAQWHNMAQPPTSYLVDDLTKLDMSDHVSV